MDTRCVPALVFMAVSAAAQPASDLLQSGIFAQEVSGDLDSAIRYYRQILSAGSSMRLYAAQAQFRLGICLLRKKDIPGARQTLQAVIDNYPGERELVARARENMPPLGVLLPAPWGDYEVTEYRWTLPGTDEGWSISRITALAKDPHKARIQTNFYSPGLNVTMIDVDRDTMQPGPIISRGPAAEKARTLEGSFSVTTPLSAFKNGGRNGTHPLYFQAELLYLLRRIPIERGKSVTIRLVSPGVAALTAVKATNAGPERVTVPAGSFDCVKLRLTEDEAARPPAFSTIGNNLPWGPDGETLWYGADGARPLIKMESGAARGELAGMRTGEPSATVYRDVSAGYSFTVPAGWIYHARTGIANRTTGSVDLIDPDSQTVVIISGHPQKTDPARIDADLQALAAGRPSADQTLTAGTLGGHKSLTQSNRRTAAGRAVFREMAESEATRVSITFQTEASDYDGVLKRLEPLFASFRMP
jgi:hypothetical protein